MALIDYEHEVSVSGPGRTELGGSIQHTYVYCAAAQATASGKHVNLIERQAEMGGGFLPPLVQQSHGGHDDERCLWLTTLNTSESKDGFAATGNSPDDTAAACSLPCRQSLSLPAAKNPSHVFASVTRRQATRQPW